MKKRGKMRKGLTIFFALIVMSILLMSSIAYAQTYSGFSRFKDNVKLFFAKGDNKVKLALEIREKEIDSAIDNVKAGNTGKAIEEIENAGEKLQIVQEQASSDVAEDVKINVDEVVEKIMESKDVDPEFSAYLEKHLTEEQKTQLSAELSEKLFNYCNELASQDFELVMKDEKCNPENAPAWLRDKIEGQVEESQKQVADEMISQLTTCINDPRECNCDKIPVASEKSKCEKNKALAIRCEFQNDMSACKQLEEMKPEVPSNMPSFLKPIFEKTMSEAISKKEKQMFNKFAPPECIEAGATTREECEKIMMEKFAPRECIEAGATTKEDCEKIMFAIHGPPPTECMENGEFIGEEACNEKMIESGRIPQECIENGKPISREECEQKMVASGRIPPECVDESGRPIPEQECLEKMLPPPCKEAGAFTREACEEIMRNYQGPPMECLDEQGNYIGDEQCQQIMQERGFQPPQQGQPGQPGQPRMPREKKTGDMRIPQECVGLTFGECEEYLMKNYMPQDCQDANALTPESCEKVMLPQECKEAGALSREECETMKIKQRMPKECREKNALTPEECGKIMSKNVVVFSPGSEFGFLSKKGIRFEQVPDACKSGSNFVRGMECDKALAEMGITLPAPSDISNIPPECIKDGVPISPQECHEILKNKLVNENIPGPCREAGITMPEECGRFMESQRKKEGIGINMPPECMGKTPDECRKIMEEKGMPTGPPQGLPQEQRGQPTGMPRECVEMGVSDSSSCDILMSKINEERMKNGDRMIVDEQGNQQYISNEQINRIAEQAEQRAEQFQPDLENSQIIREEIHEIEQEIQQVEQQQEQIELPSAEQFGQPSPEPEQGQSPEPSPAPEPSPSPEPSPTTGEIIKSITGFFAKFFGR